MSRQRLFSSQPTDVNSLYATGYYARALKTLEKLSSQRTLSINERVLLAELLSITGAITKAIPAARDLLKERGLSVAQECMLRDALGRSYFKIGQHGAGIEEYEQGIQLAEAHAAHLQGCNLRVSLFRNRIRWIGPFHATSEVSQLQRRVHHVADPALTIRFQVGLVELAARLGLFRKAHRHLNTARELLAVVDHCDLLTTVGLAEVVTTGLEGNLGRALELSLNLVEIAEESGSASASVTMATNLGYLLNAQARYTEAIDWIHKGLAARLEGGGTELALRDNLMLIHVSKGDFVEAQLESERITALVASQHEQNSFYDRWHVITRVKWLYRIGKTEQGLSEALSALPRAEHMSDRILKERLQLFVAEGLARTGHLTEAADILARTVISNADPSFEMVAEASRIRGVLLADTDVAAAAWHFERAAKVFAGIGNLAAEAEVLAEAATMYRSNDIRNRDSASPGSTITYGDRLTSLIDIASHPRLLGTSLLSFLEETTAIVRARLLEKTSAGSREVESIGIKGVVHPGKEQPIIIPLGAADREYVLEIEPAATPSDRLAVLAIEKLASAALAVDRSRQSAKEQAAIWPEAIVEEQLGLVSASERTADLINTIRRVANTNLTVLLTGESGVGKELFARALHLASPRKERTFLPFNCTGVPKDMFESQLFGHRRGAFTGAHEEGQGVIRAAAGGTLFLDEIGEMALDVQPKLLRFLESGEIHPIGEPKPQQVDVRVVAATNKDLEQLVSEGRFREDLYYRLNVLPIRIPPLRERREEIPALVEHFLERYGREMQKPMLRVADETLEYLLLYGWPGNVRQLANELRRIVALTEPGEMLTPAHLSKDITASRRTIPVESSAVVIGLDQPLQDATDQLERAAIERALTAANGNNDDAAKALGLSRKGLYLKRQRLGLK